MKKVILLVMTAIAVITIPLVAQTSVTGNIRTEIVNPITIEETEQLNFGKIVSRTAGGTVQVSPENNRVASGNVSLTSDPYNAGSFVLTGSPNMLINMVLPQNARKLRSNKSAGELTVDQFISNIPIEGQMTGSSDGKLKINIGATLYIGNWISNPSGSYSGIYEIIFPYN